MTKWEEISDILTPEGAKKLKVGEVLLFSYEGSPVHLKVKRKRNGKVYAERMHLFSPEEIETIEKERENGKAA